MKDDIEYLLRAHCHRARHAAIDAGARAVVRETRADRGYDGRISEARLRVAREDAWRIVVNELVLPLLARCALELSAETLQTLLKNFTTNETPGAAEGTGRAEGKEHGQPKT